MLGMLPSSKMANVDEKEEVWMPKIWLASDLEAGFAIGRERCGAPVDAGRFQEARTPFDIQYCVYQNHPLLVPSIDLIAPPHSRICLSHLLDVPSWMRPNQTRPLRRSQRRLHASNGSVLCGLLMLVGIVLTASAAVSILPRQIHPFRNVQVDRHGDCLHSIHAAHHLCARMVHR